MIMNGFNEAKRKMLAMYTWSFPAFFFGVAVV